jgi:hypothetical protein
MKNKKGTEEIMLVDYYKTQKEAFIAKMKSEDDERSNLKFKIAALVIYELSHTTPPWFKEYFLSNIAKNDNHTDMINEKIIKVENAFYDVIADYLIKMESEVDYVKKILSPFTEEHDKKEFWQPIVSDAFLIVGIYFTPSREAIINNSNKIREQQKEINIGSRYMHHLLISNPALASF